MILSNSMSLFLYFIIILYTVIAGVCFQRILFKEKHNILCVTMFNHKFKIERVHIISYFIIFSFVLLISAIRIDVGTDYRSYEYIFENVQKGGIQSSNISTVEYFYKVLAYLISIVSSSRSIFFLLNMIFITFPIYLLCIKEKNRIDIGFFLFLYMTLIWGMNFNITRQGISIALIGFSLYFFINRDLRKYFLCVAIASLFHSSAIIFIVLYLLRNLQNRKYSKLFRFAFVLIIIIFPFVYRELFTFLSYMLSRYTSYLGNTDEVYSSSFLYLIEKIILIIPVIYTRKYLDKDVTSLFAFIAIDIILFFPSLSLNYLYRLSYYFLPVYCFVISNLMKEMRKGQVKLCKAFECYYLVYGIIYFILNYYVLGMHGIFPYHF